jgi:hypothetical protein
VGALVKTTNTCGVQMYLRPGGRGYRGPSEATASPGLAGRASGTPTPGSAWRSNERALKELFIVLFSFYSVFSFYIVFMLTTPRFLSQRPTACRTVGSGGLYIIELEIKSSRTLIN